METTEIDSKGDGWRPFVIVAICIFLSIFAYWMLVGRAVSWDFSKSAPWGDSYAPLNTLFSGLAFAAVWASLRLQRIELSLQRRELALTRQELQRSTEAQNRLAEASEQDHLSRDGPRVVIFLRIAGWEPVLIVRNTGLTTARGLELRVAEEVEYRSLDSVDTGRKLLGDLPIFSGRGFDLAPRIDLKYSLRPHETLQDFRLSVKALYADSDGHKFQSQFDLDAALARGQMHDSQTDSLSAVVRALERVEGSLRSDRTRV